MYQEHQSRLPYYIVGLAFFTLEQMFRDRLIDRGAYYPFRAHILMLFRELAAGRCPSIDREKEIDRHCEAILKVVSDPATAVEHFKKAVQVFDECKERWTTEMGRSLFGIKDIAEFTKLLLSSVEGTKPVPADDPDAGRFRGKVAKVIIDRYGAIVGSLRGSQPISSPRGDEPRPGL